MDQATNTIPERTAVSGEEKARIAPQLRLGLRRLAKAVLVITAQHEGIRHAMAATAVSELSMAPPTLLICVNKQASLFPILSAGADFCLSILGTEQADIAAACAGGKKGEARFQHGAWLDTSLGAPRLVDAQASFACRNVLHLAYATHGVFIGEVAEVHVAGIVDPLIYVDGRYAGLPRGQAVISPAS